MTASLKNGASYPSNIETRLFINNDFVPSQSGKKFDVVNPATEKVTASVSEADGADVDAAVRAAKTAFPAWSALSGFQRAAYFYKLADLVESSNGEFAKLEAVSMGKPVGKYTEGTNMARFIRYMAGKAADVKGESSLQTPNFVNFTFRQPYGVCAAITPWNAPVTELFFKVAPAVLAGNTIVVKSSEKAPLTSLLVAKLCREAGIPAGVINVLSGTGSICGAAIASHMEIRKISFTGSARTGRAIKKAALESNLKHVTLELGGKSPLIIFEDAELDRAASAAAFSILYNSGQVCIASTRIYVHASILERFCQLLVAAVRKQGGNPSEGNDPLVSTTVRGPQADKGQFESIMTYIAGSRKAGDQILVGGDREGDRGFYIQPTIILEPDEHSAVMREEIFGPVACVRSFQTEEEVLRLANDTEYGLYASAFTRDLSRAMRMARGLESGTVGLNCTSPMMTLDMPFGGIKQSGEGRENGQHALDDWTELKTVYVGL
ncbi:hypothetical protein Z517_08424 [Fonsecaea pedrosoi CBS 271.37]|uniref:aldehyde dehydrogenase (NAD(+)) n=1 Tax=Fonsecaea pedrosoi CBS 271.37 TaxID=1442368 RepID=A0A0D2DLR0_9EURO|nr:uncharacterized protein Z517_08424 [Fonsecaea pedrosoi CBS 271.37]KIW78586.1 hypothetical protein Z517_08424 [Fonsecaea pedrosoi CBS 271.37]